MKSQHFLRRLLVRHLNIRADERPIEHNAHKILEVA